MNVEVPLRKNGSDLDHKFQNKSENRGKKTCVLSPTVIFLKYFFEFVCNKTLSAFNGARRQKCHIRGFKQNIFYKLDKHPLVAKW